MEYILSKCLYQAMDKMSTISIWADSRSPLHVIYLVIKKQSREEGNIFKNKAAALKE